MLAYDLPGCSPPTARTVTLALLLALWYSSSVVTSLTTKSILSRFPFPITLALVQQAVAAALSYMSWRKAAVQPSERAERWRTVMPVAFVMVLSLVRAEHRSPPSPDGSLARSLGTLSRLWVRRCRIGGACCPSPSPSLTPSRPWARCSPSSSRGCCCTSASPSLAC